jgi:hypothetical protein
VTIDDPDVLAELRALSDRYEAALMANDLGTLDAMFWQSQQVVRLGVGENLYGIDEIAAFRAQRPGGSPPRTVRRTTITSFGRDFGTVNVEFQREGGGPIGRQSQSWVRLPEGWRIVSAHVSLMGSGH